MQQIQVNTTLVTTHTTSPHTTNTSCGYKSRPYTTVAHTSSCPYIIIKVVYVMSASRIYNIEHHKSSIQQDTCNNHKHVSNIIKVVYTRRAHTTPTLQTAHTTIGHHSKPCRVCKVDIARFKYKYFVVILFTRL